MQLMLVGDFFQLPPVDRKTTPLLQNDELYEIGYNRKVGRGGYFAFQSHSWSKSNLCIIELLKIHRQDRNDGLLEFLNDMREGNTYNLEYNHASWISALRAPLTPRDDGIIPTELHSRNDIVSTTNTTALNNLPGESFTFKSNDEVTFDLKYKEKLLKKYDLKNVAHMPYLWASIEKQKVSLELCESQSELQVLEKKKFDLLRDEKYEELK